MAKRAKSKTDLYTILNLDQADNHVRKIGELQLQLQRLEADATDKINRIKAKLKTDAGKVQERIDKHTDSLAVFAKSHPEHYKSRRSILMVFGKIGFRKTTKVATKKSTLQKIKDVFGSKKKQYIHIKESPDKEALAKLTDQQLASVDARRVVTDDFFAEPDLAEVKKLKDGS